MRIKESTATEILDVLQKPYLTTKDISVLASVGINKATEIRNKIIKELKEKNILFVNNFLPNKEVVEYLHIDINYLKKIERGKIWKKF